MLERMLLGMDESSIYLCPAPLYHAAAIAMVGRRARDGRARVVVMERFDPERFLA